MGSGVSPGPSCGIVVIEPDGRGQSRRMAGLPRPRPAGFMQPGSSTPGRPGPAVGAGGRVRPRRGGGLTTVGGPRVRVTINIGTVDAGVSGRGVGVLAARTGGRTTGVAVTGRTVESALPYVRTAGGSLRSAPSATPSPSPPEAATTVTAAIDTVARAAKLACESCAPNRARDRAPDRAPD
ncbi:hypothetical protein E1286_27915, partial [Nonomuraea terrae]